MFNVLYIIINKVLTFRIKGVIIILNKFKGVDKMIETNIISSAERREKILELIENKGKIFVNELIECFKGISPASIRRDLRILESQGVIERSYGYVQLTKRDFLIPSLERKMKINVEEKKRIAKAILELIEEGDTLFLDTGSTLVYIAKELKALKGIMVITNSIPVIKELEKSPYIKIIGIGGVYQFNEQCFVGSIAEEYVSRYKADKAIIGADGFSFEEGVTSHDPENAGVTRLVVENAETVIVAADYTKIGVRGVVPIAPIEKIDIVVTNKELEPEKVSILENNGIKVILT